jgi:hypothetical protein
MVRASLFNLRYSSIDDAGKPLAETSSGALPDIIPAVGGWREVVARAIEALEAPAPRAYD